MEVVAATFVEVRQRRDVSGQGGVGDVVRTMKQLVDLARQITLAADAATRRRAAEVAEHVFRGNARDSVVGVAG